MKEGFELRQELKKLPHSPGVYIMHDSNDEVIYVGKAVDLNNRVKSYFRQKVGRGPWIDKMVSLIYYFEYIVTDSELEALILENNLIKEHLPKYNTMLMDDKTYPYIKVTLDREFPGITFERKLKKDKAKYFGPFTSAAAVKDTIELVNKLFMLRTCNVAIKEGEKALPRPCLNYHMGRCMAPCRGNVTKESYDKKLKEALSFLNGNYEAVLKDLQREMEKASENLEFEKAMTYRDLINSVKACGQNQKITDSGLGDRDIIGIALGQEDAVIHIFFVRNGRMIGRDHFYIKIQEGNTKHQIIESFIKQYYSGVVQIPPEIYLPVEIEDREAIQEFLKYSRGNKVTLVVPQKGQKEKLVELANENARLVLTKDKERIRREQEKTLGALQELMEITGLRGINRIEAFDISNTSGYGNVASMVVFEEGKPKRNFYRKFRIKSVEGPNDYGCMKEVITRRLAGEHSDAHGPEPDLFLMDGGKGQVNIALQVLEELNISIPVCGMVKDDHHRTRGLYYNNRELPIDKSGEAFRLITRIQDEAHRFAITYHRQVRGKDSIHSVLDEIPGIGPVRRKERMMHFENIDEIKNADIGKLNSILPKQAAKSVYMFFHENKSAKEES